jgi:hypothetical protein
MANCPQGYATRVITRDGEDFYKFVAIPCKTWSCEKCSKRLTWEFIERINFNFSNTRTRFGTLTFDPKLHDLDTCWKMQSKKFAQLIRLLKKDFYIQKYVKILESHKNGFPHIHFLADAYVPVRTLSAIWQHIGCGKVVWMQEVPPLAVSGYVAKYLSKQYSQFDQFQNYFTKYNVRRFSFSLTCKKKPYIKQGKYYYLGKNKSEAYHTFMRSGEMHLLSDGSVTFLDDNFSEFKVHKFIDETGELADVIKQEECKQYRLNF